MQYASFVISRQALGGKFGTQRVHARLKKIGSAAFERFLAALLHRELEHVGIDRTRGASVFSKRDIYGWLREIFPATEFHVEHRLSADDLGRRRDERNPAKTFADVGDLEQHLLASQARAAALEREAEHAQLLALRSHFDPHFLFNTLNAIAEWCREDGLVAERAILALSSMLHTIMTAIRATRWPLARSC